MGKSERDHNLINCRTVCYAKEIKLFPSWNIETVIWTTKPAITGMLFMYWIQYCAIFVEPAFGQQDVVMTMRVPFYVENADQQHLLFP